jgi:hypothetical protein
MINSIEKIRKFCITVNQPVAALERPGSPPLEARSFLFANFLLERSKRKWQAPVCSNRRF